MEYEREPIAKECVESNRSEEVMTKAAVFFFM